MITLPAYVVLAAALFCIGVFGLLTRRNAIGILLSVELMANAVNINLAAFGRFHGDVRGDVFVLFAIGLTVAEVVVGLAIVIFLHRVRKTIEVEQVNLLSG